MTMAMERRIAFAVFAVGILIAIVALAGCGEDDNAAIVENDCAGRHSSHPTVGFEYLDGRESVRLIAPGPACGYAFDLVGDELYVELRRPTEIPVDFENLACFDVALDRPAPTGTSLEAIVRGRPKLAPEGEVDALLSGPDACPSPERIQPSFVID